MRILILGAGAVGGYYGARLIQVGADVTFLVRPEKQRLLRKNGLVIETSDETVKLNPPTVTKESLNSEVDLVVLTPKSYDFAEAIEVVQNVQGKPFLLPFLNGIDHLHQMDLLFGKERVMAGAAYVSTTLTADGAVQLAHAVAHLQVVGPPPAGERDHARVGAEEEAVVPAGVRTKTTPAEDA